MSAILPISSVRVSDSLVRTRLTQQVQSDQLALFRIQSQLSTGRRIFSPSEDASSALRAITLQRNLERQTQLQLNLDSSSQALTAAGSALGLTTDELTSVRGAALGVVGTDATQEQRDAIIQVVDEAIDRLQQFGNSQFRDNFLFGGSFGGAEPYVAINEYIEYRGDEQSLQQFVDTNLLFDINITGQESLGGISEAVRGTSGLSPQLTSDTLLSQLNGGAGVPRDGAIQIDFLPDNPGGVVTESTTIDLRAANTVGDVARLIEAGAPPSAGLRVSLVGDRLELQTSGAAAGSVTINEVGLADTARQLGIETTTPASSVTGESLDPTLRLTTPLDTLLGSRAQARVISAGSNNDLILTATQNGTNVDPDDPASDPLNGVTIAFSDTDTVAAGNETVDLTGGVLTVQIEPGVTTAEQVAAAINNASIPFTAALDPSDALTFGETGSGVVDTTTTATTAGGGGRTLDLAAGLQIQNGEGVQTIDTSNAETVFDLLETLNRPELGLVAELNSTQTGIDVRTRRSGADFAIGENGGDLATQLGLRTFTGESRLEDFNRGIGAAVPGQNAGDFAVQNEFRISITDEGVTQAFDIDLTGSVAADGTVTGIDTVDDLIAAIDSQTGGAVRAELAAFGNGLVLSGTNTEVTSVAQAVGTFALAGDTLQFEAVSTGFEGNQDFSIAVVDNGTDGLQASVDGNAITVNLGGASPAPTTAQIADAINAELTDFNVTSIGVPGSVVFPTGPTVSAIGGQDLAAAVGTQTIDGDTLRFEAVTPGAAGNQSFTLNITNTTNTGRTINVTGNTIDVELGELSGVTVDTATLAGEIDALLADFNVSTTGAPATVTAQSGLLVDTLNGADLASASGTATLPGGDLRFDATAGGVAGNQSFAIEVIDSGAGGLATTVDAGVITVDLGGSPTPPDTAEVAASIDAQLADFTVTATTPVGAVAVPTVSTTGGLGLSPEGADTITVSGDAAQRLGFFSADADPASASGVTVASDDRNTLEVDSAFNSLIRLRTALEEGDVVAIGEAIDRLDDDLNRAVFAESEVGSRVQTLEVLGTRLDDEEVQLRSALSDEIDVDLAEAISEFTARQFALQASLQTSANLLQLSILDFI